MFILIVFLVLTATLCNAESELKLNDSSSVYRLPENVIPSIYQLWLLVDVDHFKFSGNVTISITVLEPTNKIVLNANGISIDSSSVILDKLNGNSSTIQSSRMREQYQMIDFIFNETLFTGNYELTLKFEGTFRDDEIGLYRTWYFANGTLR